MERRGFMRLMGIFGAVAAVKPAADALSLPAAAPVTGSPGSVDVTMSPGSLSYKELTLESAGAIQPGDLLSIDGQGRAVKATSETMRPIIGVAAQRSNFMLILDGKEFYVDDLEMAISRTAIDVTDLYVDAYERFIPGPRESSIRARLIDPDMHALSRDLMGRTVDFEACYKTSPRGWDPMSFRGRACVTRVDCRMLLDDLSRADVDMRLVGPVTYLDERQ